MRGSSGGSSSKRRPEAEAAKRQTDEEAVERCSARHGPAAGKGEGGGAVRQSQHRGG
jgi:hypothetical protein